MEISFCKECGAKLDASCRFCMSCGTPVDVVPEYETVDSQPAVPSWPYVVVNADESKKRTKERRKNTKRTERGFGGALLSTILCVLIFAFLLLSIGIVSVRQASSPLEIRHMLDGVDLAELRLSNGNDVGEELQESILEPMDITDDISEIINSDTVRIAVADKLSAYLRDLYSDTGEGEIRTEDITDLFNKISEDIEELLDINIDSAVFELLEETLQEQEILDDLSLAAFEKENNLEYQVLHWGLSYYAVSALLVLCVLIALLVHRSNKKAYHYTLSNIGWTLTLEGGILLVAYYANKWILTQLSVFLALDRELVGAVSKGILGAGLPMLYTMTVLGVVFIITGIILKASYKRMQQPKTAVV